MSPGFGICLRDVPHPEGADGWSTDLVGAIDAAAALGANLLHLPAVGLASTDLDPGELAHVRAAARESGVSLSVGLPAAHPDRAGDLWGADVGAPTHPFAQIEAARLLGAQSLHLTVGTDADRFRDTPTWADQLERSVPLLRELRQAASDIPLVLKTHEEMTTYEAVRLCEQVQGLRLGFSPVNVLARLESPLRAAQRVAALTHTVFLDDCAVVRDPAGLTRVMRGLGDGALPWDAMLALLPPDAPRVIDLHRAELSMPAFDPAWIAHEHEASVAEVAELWRLAQASAPRTDPLTTRQDAALRFVGASTPAPETAHS